MTTDSATLPAAQSRAPVPLRSLRWMALGTECFVPYACDDAWKVQAFGQAGVLSATAFILPPAEGCILTADSRYPTRGFFNYVVTH